MERMRNSLWTACVWIDMPVSKHVCAEGGLGGNKSPRVSRDCWKAREACSVPSLQTGFGIP